LRRLIVAVVILIFVTVLSITTLNAQTKGIYELIEITDKMQETFDNKEMDKCLEMANDFVDKFQKTTRFFPLFMRHSDVMKIEETVVMLPIFLQTDESNFTAELVRCKNMLENLAKLETPSLENIL